MRTNYTLALLFAALLPAGAAGAQSTSTPPIKNPKGWVTVETLGFRMALPAHYHEFYGSKKDPDANPHYGSWGFMSPHATRKIYVRVTPLHRGTVKALLEEGERHIRKKAGEVKLLEMIPIPKDDLGRDGAIGVYRGVMQALSHKTKKMNEYHHIIIRGVLRYPKWKMQLAVTHMVRGDKQADAVDMYLLHIQTFKARSPADAKRLAAKARAAAAKD